MRLIHYIIFTILFISLPLLGQKKNDKKSVGTSSKKKNEIVHYPSLLIGFLLGVREEEHNIKFIGPNSKHIELMGNKIVAKKLMSENGIPTVPGLNNVDKESELNAFIDQVGFPIIIKAASGGGGKGMRVVNKKSELRNQLEAAKLEAKKAFNDDTVYIEKYLTSPKHIEIHYM